MTSLCPWEMCLSSREREPSNQARNLLSENKGDLSDHLRLICSVSLFEGSPARASARMTHLCSVHVVFAPLNFKVCVHLSNEGFVRCDLFRPLHYMNAAWWYLTPTFVVMCGQQLLWLVPLCHRHIRFVNAWSSGRFLLGKSSFNRLISQWSCSSCCLFSNFESLSKSPTNHFRFLIYVLFHPGLVKSWLQQNKERLCKKTTKGIFFKKNTTVTASLTKNDYSTSSQPPPSIISPY